MPALLLKSPTNLSLSSPNFPAPFDQSVNRDFFGTSTHDFRAVRDIADSLRSEKVQNALRAAQSSEEADKSELSMVFRTESRKRKRPMSPVGSPQPYIPPPPPSSSLFPPVEDEPPPLRAEGLIDYIREFNLGRLGEYRDASVGDRAAPSCRLHIWSRTRMVLGDTTINHKTSPTAIPAMQKLSSPLILRLTILDVLTAYVSLTFEREEDPLVVETVAAFGPREKKLPHMQSDYLAFQVLSQHIAKMVQSHPRVPFQTLLHLLTSYRGLFVDRCTSCERVLSADGHVPPVGRVWIVNSDLGPSNVRVEASYPTAGNSVGSGGDQSRGHWDPRHVTC
ncbi:hypothetical protein BV22DRAFT_1047842 [Leucogyrophana mollusca]|uniref:Uncharacterized protein n=1 Tax=Leucogyrophana mollusca TaxID=85980 RepID=A0ACB8BGL8_9AGAM|nr:hypothetical protein BV22DRAFT_1047842 [Leucogyrophana mollusca]